MQLVARLLWQYLRGWVPEKVTGHVQELSWLGSLLLGYCGSILEAGLQRKLLARIHELSWLCSLLLGYCGSFSQAGLQGKLQARLHEFGWLGSLFCISPVTMAPSFRLGVQSLWR